MLGSRLDVDVKTSNCRLAFHGRLSHAFRDRDYLSTDLAALRVFKNKTKEGVVERANGETEVICKASWARSVGGLTQPTTTHSR